MSGPSGRIVRQRRAIEIPGSNVTMRSYGTDGKSNLEKRIVRLNKSIHGTRKSFYHWCEKLCLQWKAVQNQTGEENISRETIGPGGVIVNDRVNEHTDANVYEVAGRPAALDELCSMTFVGDWHFALNVGAPRMACGSGPALLGAKARQYTQPKEVRIYADAPERRDSTHHRQLRRDQDAVSGEIRQSLAERSEDNLARIMGKLVDAGYLTEREACRAILASPDQTYRVLVAVGKGEIDIETMVALVR